VGSISNEYIFLNTLHSYTPRISAFLEKISRRVLLESNKTPAGENVVLIERRHLHKILSRALGKELITSSYIVE
jgi:hypothetical protein